MLSGDHQEAYFKKAQQVPRLINKFTEQLLTYFDYLKLPITPMTAFTFGATKADLVAGMHAISIPKKIDDAGKQVFANVF
jgi:Asp-tRNA(Asn)/Glu-tRNA(Gln) amidotransferase A subunit family amidase